MVKRGRIISFFLIVILMFSLIGVTIEGIVKKIDLGLDLQGGFEILYEVKPIQEDQEVNKELLLSTVSALYKRVGVLGVNEPNIQIEGNDRIRVQLAGVEDQTKAREILATEANLSFRDVNDRKLLDGADLKEGGAAQSFGQNGQPVVTLTLKDANKFGQVTEEILQMAPNNLLVIWMDFREGVDSYLENPQNENILSAATVRQVLNTTDVMIEGNFTVESAKELADLLNAGSLPVELTEIYSTSVGAQFGEKALEQTIFAGYIGIGLIFLFMIIVYRIPGVISVITLTIYIYLILLVFEWMNALLTLPGIAALILGVGMAVDANIITFERIKDELKSGKSILSSYRAGNRNSFSSIVDANLTTMIAAVVLFIYGTSSVKGFATMLIVSILVSFLTAVYGTRLLLGLLVNSRALKKPSYFNVRKADIADINEVNTEEIRVTGIYKNLDFIKHSKKFFILSTAMVVIGIGLLATFKLNLGIDFASGTRIEVMATEQLSVEKLSEELAELGFDYEPELSISGNNQELGVIRYKVDLSQQEIAQVKAHFHEIYGSEPNVSTVSPTVGRELARNAFIAVMIASVGIIIYITVRFEIFFALAAITALLHDAFFIVAFFSLTRLEVDLTFIAAVLTIIGYSINDTIVTFDRIRENMRLKPVKTYDDLRDIVNKSLIQTLTRSLNTIITIIFTVVALILFGSEAIRNFSIALLVGLIAGVYSSLFIAAQLFLVWKGKSLGRKKKVRQEDEDDFAPDPEV